MRPDIISALRPMLKRSKGMSRTMDYCLFVLLTFGLCTGAGAHVFYEYYEAAIDNTVFASMPPYETWTPKKTGIIDGFDIGIRDRDDDFAFRFTSFLAVPTAGDYTFWIASDDGSQVTIDGELIVDNGGWHGMGTVGTGSVYLNAGFHSIVVTYFEDTGDEGLQVDYAGPGIVMTAIPQAALVVDANYPAGPYPVDSATKVELNADLHWLPGNAAVVHEVYFGRTDPPPFVRNQIAAGFDPGQLEYLTDYYWRIVETDGVNRWEGDVWRFTTKPDPTLITDVNLVGWWKFDGDCSDSSGYGSDGTPFGSGISFTAAPERGQVVSLNGSDDFVAVGDVGISGDSARTICGWAKADAAVISDWTNIFGFTGPSGAGGHFDIEVVGDTTDTDKGYGIHCYSWQRNIFAGTDLDWHHFAATYDGVTVKWYGDGQLIGSEDYAIDVPDNFQIGKRQDNDNFFGGQIDDVRIYDYALSDSDIAELGLANIATNPSPEDGEVLQARVWGSNVFMILDYTAGKGAVAHTGYFSEDIGDVIGRDAAHRLDSPPWPEVYAEAFCVGFNDMNVPAFARPPLVRGRAYYWAVDEFDGATTWPGPVWSFRLMPEGAWAPQPRDGDFLVGTAPALTWRPGDVDSKSNSVTYDLYYGTDAASVEASTTAITNVKNPAHTLAGLNFGTEYFWRIDTRVMKNSPPFETRVVKGRLWSFMTAPQGLGEILREWWTDIGGSDVSDLTDDLDFPDVPDGSEMLGSFEGPEGWGDYYGSRMHGWLYIRTSGDYTFWISSDDESELWLSIDEDPANPI